MRNKDRNLSRRDFLQYSAAAMLASSASWSGAVFGDQHQGYKLTAPSARVQLAGPPFPATETWSFNQNSPGPLLKFRQGQPASIEVSNQLSQGMTVHWHG